MNRVLVELYVPAIGEHFDMFVPTDVPIQKLNKIIASGVAELTNGIYIVSNEEQLCTKEPCGVLNPMLTLQDYGANDGEQIYLI